MLNCFRTAPLIVIKFVSYTASRCDFIWLICCACVSLTSKPSRAYIVLELFNLIDLVINTFEQQHDKEEKRSRQEI